MIHSVRTSTNWKENISSEFAKCSIIGKDLQNFIIESTNRERDKKLKYKKKGWIYVPVEFLIVSSGRLGTDTLGIAHEKSNNGQWALHSLLAINSPSIHFNPCFQGILVFRFHYFQLLLFMKRSPSPLHFIHHSQTSISS